MSKHEHHSTDLLTGTYIGRLAECLRPEPLVLKVVFSANNLSNPPCNQLDLTETGLSHATT
jgi:hypothetical protein